MSTPFPITAARPVTYNGPLPDAADVVVIGGGVIGVCTALFLARDGHRVVLLEKGRISAEQSSRNWGWIRQQGRDPDELPIMKEANALWRSLAAETNVDIGLTRGGVTYLAPDGAAMARYEAWQKIRIGAGCGYAAFVARTNRQAYPRHVATIRRRALYPVGYAGRARGLPSLHWRASRCGMARGLIENCAVRCLDIEAGEISGVLTERGRIATSQVVLAGGGVVRRCFWQITGLNCPNCPSGPPLPQPRRCLLSLKVARLMTVLAFRLRRDGGYTLASGGFHELFIGPSAFRVLPKFLTQLRADPFGTRFLPAAPKGYPDSWGIARRWDADMVSPFEGHAHS